MESIPEVKEVFGKRLGQARKMKGWSLRELSERMNSSVSYNALHKYEAGLMLPESPTLRVLAQALEQPVDFFFRPLTVTLEAIEFRKKSKLGVKQIDAIREEATDFFERYLQVEEALGLTVAFTNPLKGTKVSRPGDIEVVAQKLRAAWDLGSAPLTNVVELLERHQIKVLLQDADTGFDGFSGWSGSIPVVVLNGSFPVDRIRLTALHELGHLIMSFDPAFDEKTVEKLCHRFAGAMLIPRQVFEREFGAFRSQISLEELKDIKGDYGISIAAIMARAKDLGFISEGTFKQFCIQRNKWGWNKQEPGSYEGEKFPNRFEQLLYRAVTTEALSFSLGASLAKKPLEVFKKSMQLVP